jgi:hypothetical protein
MNYYSPYRNILTKLICFCLLIALYLFSFFTDEYIKMHNEQLYCTNIYKYLHISHLRSIYKRLLQSANLNQPSETIATLEREREREQLSIHPI